MDIKYEEGGICTIKLGWKNPFFLCLHIPPRGGRDIKWAFCQTKCNLISRGNLSWKKVKMDWNEQFPRDHFFCHPRAKKNSKQNRYTMLYFMTRVPLFNVSSGTHHFTPQTFGRRAEGLWASSILGLPLIGYTYSNLVLSENLVG